MSGPFTPSARFYDLVYRHLDYPATAVRVEGMIRERNSGAASLLDVACGTGKHLQIWRDRFDHVEGTDVDPAMLEIAAGRLPGVPLHRADFTAFDLGRRFDAVTCLFSSIGYARTPDRLDAALAAMARHLTPGGVLVVEPWFQPGVMRPPWVRVQVAESDDMVVARTTRHLRPGDPTETDMEFTYLVTTPDGSSTFAERHVMGLFPAERYVEAAERAGLSAEFDPDGSALGRGMLIGVGPPGPVS